MGQQNSGTKRHIACFSHGTHVAPRSHTVLVHVHQCQAIELVNSTKAHAVQALHVDQTEVEHMNGGANIPGVSHTLPSTLPTHVTT